MKDRTDLSYWFPIIKRAGLPVPETRVITTDVELIHMLDGDSVDGYNEFITELKTAVAEIGTPCFLRTGMGSGKHSWKETCFLTDAEDIPGHVYSLVEWSHTVDFFGLAHDTWVVRKLIPTNPLFYAFWGKMPITSEFRFFVRGETIEHVQPYWPPHALEGHVHDCTEWRDVLAEASRLDGNDLRICREIAQFAGRVLAADAFVNPPQDNGGDFWSVDLLQDATGGWWLTDMALGDESFRWDPETGSSNQEPPYVEPDFEQSMETADD